MDRLRALKAMRLEPTDRIPMWEHFSNPDAEFAITGIDPWDKPKSARERLIELTHMDVGGIPGADTPIERLPDGQSSFVDAEGRTAVRWGTGVSWHWDWGKKFKTIEDVISYSPLANPDQSKADVVESRDYSISVEDLAKQYQAGFNYARQLAGNRSLITGGFYNTLFMWPLLSFDWELFLELGAAYKDECKRLLSEFATFSRKAFHAMSMTDIEVIVCHDDICFQAGPVFSPAWLREMIYPYYEEFWSHMHAAGKRVIFMCDGNVDQVADDIFACGADGIVSEPYTNWPEIAKKYPDKIYAGDGDNRVLATGDREAVFAMVKKMTDWGKQYPGYFLCVGNHIPWNVSVEGVKAYFEAAELYGARE